MYTNINSIVKQAGLGHKLALGVGAYGGWKAKEIHDKVKFADNIQKQLRGVDKEASTKEDHPIRNAVLAGIAGSAVNRVSEEGIDTLARYIPSKKLIITTIDDHIKKTALGKTLNETYRIAPMAIGIGSGLYAYNKLSNKEKTAAAFAPRREVPVQHKGAFDFLSPEQKEGFKKVYKGVKDAVTPSQKEKKASLDLELVSAFNEACFAESMYNNALDKMAAVKEEVAANHHPYLGTTAGVVGNYLGTIGGLGGTGYLGYKAGQRALENAIGSETAKQFKNRSKLRNAFTIAKSGLSLFRKGELKKRVVEGLKATTKNNPYALAAAGTFLATPAIGYATGKALDRGVNNI